MASVVWWPMTVGDMRLRVLANDGAWWLMMASFLTFSLCSRFATLTGWFLLPPREVKIQFLHFLAHEFTDYVKGELFSIRDLLASGTF